MWDTPKIKMLVIEGRDIVILAILLMIAGLIFAGRSLALEFNTSIQGAAPLLLSYYNYKTVSDVSSGLGLSYDGGTANKKKTAIYDNWTSGTTTNSLEADDQTLVLDLFKFEWEREKRKRSKVVFGMSALSHDTSAGVDPSDQSLSANFESKAPITEEKPLGLFDRIKETLLMIHFTIRY